MANVSGGPTAAGGAAGTTVLVVEDEPAIAQAIVHRLSAEGWTVEVGRRRARRGRAPRRGCDPDVVVLDVMLPGIDGLEVCRRIQAERPVPVLMLTARDDETDMLDRPRRRRRRLHDQAVLDARARGAHQGAAAPHRAGRRGPPRWRPPSSPTRRSSSATSPSTAPSGACCAGTTEVHLTPTEFDLLLALAATPAHRPDPRAPARRGVGLGRRQRHPHGRLPHQGAAPQARPRPDPHGARRRATRSSRATAAGPTASGASVPEGA